MKSLVEKINESKKKDLIKHTNDAVTKDFSKLWDLTRDEIGAEDIHEYLGLMGDFVDDNYEVYQYKFNENVFWYLLRCIVNYDLIRLDEYGKIDVKNSNHPDIAKILNKYNTEKIGKEVFQSIFIN